MPEHVLESDNFSLRLSLNVFESDIEYPINTNMTVFVTCNEFSAKADMDINIKDFAKFSMELMAIYNSLKGESTIKEPYGYEKFISFVAGRTGHIVVERLTVSRLSCGRTMDSSFSTKDSKTGSFSGPATRMNSSPYPGSSFDGLWKDCR